MLLLCSRKGLLDTYASDRRLGTTVFRKWPLINDLRGDVWVLLSVRRIFGSIFFNRDRASSTRPARAGPRTNRSRQKEPRIPRKIRSLGPRPQKPRAAEPDACYGTWDRPLSGSRKSEPRTGARTSCKRIQRSACMILRVVSSRIYEVLGFLTNKWSAVTTEQAWPCRFPF